MVHLWRACARHAQHEPAAGAKAAGSRPCTSSTHCAQRAAAARRAERAASSAHHPRCPLLLLSVAGPPRRAAPRPLAAPLSLLHSPARLPQLSHAAWTGARVCFPVESSGAAAGRQCRASACARRVQTGEMLARGARTLLARNLPVLQSQTRGLLVRKGKKAPEDSSRALVKTGNDAWVAVKDKETGERRRARVPRGCG